MSMETENHQNGLKASLRIMVAIFVLIIAATGMLIVLDVIALEAAGEMAKKSLILGVIVALTSVVLALLLKSKK